MRSSIRDRVYLVRLDPHKDVSEMYLADRANFLLNIRSALANAVSLAQLAREVVEETRQKNWQECQHLAMDPAILDRFTKELATFGVVGEERAAKLIYLILTSRLLDQPISAAVKGPSSSGKSYLVSRVLKFFPPTAYLERSAMSERALAYGEYSLKHKFIVLFEAAGLGGDIAQYLMRSLLSEGRINYETVDKSEAGRLGPRVLEREGPTGLLVTTTEISLHPENETRLFSIPVTDNSGQTAAILLSIGQAAQGIRNTAASIDPAWLKLQTWIETGELEVLVPFAVKLSQGISPVAVRLRRDFGKIINLIKAHALLHQATRRRDERGRILAETRDYACVRTLVADLIKDAAQITASATIAETVGAVKSLGQPCTLKQVGEKLSLDKSATSRRIKAAIADGYLVNTEEKKGRPMKLTVGDPVPQSSDLLPSRKTVPVALLQTPMPRGAPPPPSPKQPR